VYDAKQATRMDKATRYGSYVPVTTIGIAPIFGPKAPRQHSATSLLQSGIAGHRLFVYPNYGTVREVSEPPSTTRLHPEYGGNFIDHLVRADDRGRWHVETERLGGRSEAALQCGRRCGWRERVRLLEVRDYFIAVSHECIGTR
jgi:hypothetical protein